MYFEKEIQIRTKKLKKNYLNFSEIYKYTNSLVQRECAVTR